MLRPMILCLLILLLAIPGAAQQPDEMRTRAVEFILASEELAAWLTRHENRLANANVIVAPDTVAPFYSWFASRIAVERAGDSPPSRVFSAVADSLVKIDAALPPRSERPEPDVDSPPVLYFTHPHADTIAATLTLATYWTDEEDRVLHDPSPPRIDFLVFFDEEGRPSRMISIPL